MVKLLHIIHSHKKNKNKKAKAKKGRNRVENWTHCQGALHGIHGQIIETRRDETQRVLTTWQATPLPTHFPLSLLDAYLIYRLFTSLLIYLHTYLPTYLPTYPPIHPSIHLLLKLHPPLFSPSSPLPFSPPLKLHNLTPDRRLCPSLSGALGSARLVGWLVS